MMRSETQAQPAPQTQQEPPSGEVEAALLARIAAGQSDALAAFYDRTARIALGLLARILGDVAEAEEICRTSSCKFGARRPAIARSALRRAAGC